MCHALGSNMNKNGGWNLTHRRINSISLKTRDHIQLLEILIAERNSGKVKILYRSKKFSEMKPGTPRILSTISTINRISLSPRVALNPLMISESEK